MYEQICSDENNVYSLAIDNVNFSMYTPIIIQLQNTNVDVDSQFLNMPE